MLRQRLDPRDRTLEWPQSSTSSDRGTGSGRATPRSCDPAPPRSPRRTSKPHAPSHLRTSAPSAVLTHSGRLLPRGRREEQQEQRGAAKRQPPAQVLPANPAGPHSASGLADRSSSQEACVGKSLPPEVGGAGGTGRVRSRGRQLAPPLALRPSLVNPAPRLLARRGRGSVRGSS